MSQPSILPTNYQSRRTPSRQATPFQQQNNQPTSYQQPQAKQMKSPFQPYPAEKVGRYVNRPIRYNPINNTYILPETKPQAQPQNITQAPASKVFQPGTNKTTLGLPPQLESVIQQIRNAIKIRGASGLSAFLRTFKLVDRGNKRNLSFDDIEKVMNLYRLNLNFDELNILFVNFDRNKLNLANYDDMVQSILGGLSPKREELVKALFYKLNRGTDYVNSDDLQNFYNCSLHPDVINGTKSENQILNEWLYNFEAFAEFYQIGVRNWPMIYDEFVRFFNMMSFSIEDDTVFENILNNCWERATLLASRDGYNPNANNTSQMGRAGELIMGGSSANAGIIGRRF